MEREVEDEKLRGSVIVEVKAGDEIERVDGRGRSKKIDENNNCESSQNKNEEEKFTSGDGEKMCRICHLSNRESSNSEELIQLGCECKQELGASHLTCAQTWFKLKGNRLCEICGKSAVNVGGAEETNTNNNNRSVILVVEWEEVRPTNGTNIEVDPDRCQRTFRNVVLTCLLLAFVVPWFFRINLF